MPNQQVASDNFNRADSNSWGTGWTESEASPFQTFVISGNQGAVQLGTTDIRCGSALRTESYNNDQYSTATFKSYSTNNASNLAYGGLVVRGSGSRASFTGYGILPGNSGGTNSRLVKWVNANLASNGNGRTDLATGLTISNNDILEIRANGTTISVLKNGSQIASVTDSAISTGVPGFAAQFPPFTVSEAFDSRWDDWSGGNILPPDVSVNVTGVSSSCSAGTVTVQTSANPAPTGVASNASAGSPTITGTAVVNLTGVASTASPGNLAESISDDVSITGVASIASAGSVTVLPSIEVSLSGVESVCAAGDVIAGQKYTNPLVARGRIIYKFAGSGSVH